MITIIGMKLPDNCEECRFSILMRDDVYCTAMNGETTILFEDDWHLKRTDRCPLVDAGFPEYCRHCGKRL